MENTPAADDPTTPDFPTAEDQTDPQRARIAHHDASPTGSSAPRFPAEIHIRPRSTASPPCAQLPTPAAATASTPTTPSACISTSPNPPPSAIASQSPHPPRSPSFSPLPDAAPAYATYKSAHWPSSHARL